MTPRAVADPAGAGQRVRQDRAGELASALHAAGVEIVSTGSTASRDRGGRHPGDPGRGADRLPGVPRRPGQDAAPAGARRPARRPAPPAHVAAAGRAGDRAVRPAGVQPVPVPRDGRLRRRARTSASSRSTSAARRWCGRRRRTTPSVAVVTSPGGVPAGPRGAGRRRVHPGASAGGWRRAAFADTADVRRRGGQLVARTLASGDRTGRPRLAGARRWRRKARRCATARTRTSRPRSTSTRPRRPGLAQAEQLHGKEMSYNNYVDADAAWRAANDFTEPAWRSSSTPTRAASRSAPTSPRRTARPTPATRCRAFGGVIAANRPVTRRAGRAGRGDLHRGDRRAGVRRRRGGVLRDKKNLRLLVAPGRGSRPPAEFRQVGGGMLVQTRGPDRRARRRPGQLDAAAGEPADEATLADLAFAWRACRSVKSNAILLAADGATVGVGMGQVNRVDAARLAVDRAGRPGRGAVAASDAFFPFAGRPAGPDRRRGRGRSCSPAGRSATRR